MQAGVVNIVSTPAKELEFLVRKYFLLKAQGGERILDKHIPDGSASIVFNFSGNIGLLHSSVMLPDCFLTYPHLGNVPLITTPPAETFIVVCKTSVLTRLFKIDCSQLSWPPYLNAEAIFSNTLRQQMKDEPQHEMRVKLFEDFIIRFKNGRKYFPDKIDEAYNQIYSGDGLLPVEEIAAQVKINVRTLRRNFKKRTGLCPKSLSRIVRLNYLWKSVADGVKVDFQSLAFLGDFFDQAHFIRDFEEVFGERPHSFFNRDLKKVKMLSGFNASPV